MPKKVTAKPQTDGSVLIEENVWKTKEGNYRARRRGRGGQLRTFGALAKARAHRDSQPEAAQETDLADSRLDAIAANYIAANSPSATKPGAVWSAGTAQARAAYWRKLSGTFGALKPDAATKTIVRNWIASQRALHMSDGTILNHVKFLTSLLDYAIEAGAATRNGARGTMKGSGALPAGWGRARALDDAQADAWVSSMPERFQIAGQLALYCGLRSGEVRGLTVDRVDFLRGTITVDRQLIDTPSGHDHGDAWHCGPATFSETKTKRTRVLDVGREITDLIAAHLAQHKTPTNGPAFVISSQGHAVSRGTFRNAWIMAQTAQRGTVRFHDLRHTFVTGLLDDSVPVATVAELAGHSSATVTMNTYAHPTAQGRDAAKASIAGRLARTIEASGTIPAQSAAAGS